MRSIAATTTGTGLRVHALPTRPGLNRFLRVTAALAVAREAQARCGLSINKILKTLRPLRLQLRRLAAFLAWYSSSPFQPRHRDRPVGILVL